MSGHVMRWVVRHGFQDEFQVHGIFGSEPEAVAFCEARGWSLDNLGPLHPHTWISHELCRRA